MKRAYILSYYQAKNFLTEGITWNHHKYVLGRILQKGVMQVSDENFKFIGRQWSAGLLDDYLTALYCDMEVAIQEKKLTNLAKEFGFEAILEKGYRPDLEYLDDFSVDKVHLTPKEIFAGNTYIINTHGREQSIDGYYKQAIYKENIQRILIDACSSAGKYFPIKNSGNKSVVEIVAEECAKAGRNNDLEIVGYNEKFTINQTQTTAYAAFGSKESLSQKGNLTLLTVNDRKKQLEELEKQKQEKAKQAKLKLFHKLSNGSLGREKELLKNALIDVCSKWSHTAVTHLLHLDTRKNIHQYSEEVEFLMNVTGNRERCRTIINEGSKKNIKAIGNLLKEQRKSYFEERSYSQLIDLAKEAINIGKNLNDLSKDTITSMGILEILMDIGKENIIDDNLSFIR